MTMILRTYGKRGGWWTFVGPLHKLTPFKTGGYLSATDKPEWRWGRLPIEWRDSVKQADYVVYSWSTPIAWHIPRLLGDLGGGWVVPDVHYSVTTTRHQNLIRTALGDFMNDKAEPEYDNGDHKEL